MDQKKTLWIIAAVGAFLLIVLGAAYIIYPKTPQVEQTITRTLPEQKKASSVSDDDGWIPPVTLPNEISVSDLTVFSENTNVYGFDTGASTDATTIDLNSLKNTINDPVAAAPKENVSITVEIKDPEVKPVAAANPSSNDYYVAPAAKTVEKSPVTQKVVKTNTAKTTTSTTTSTVTKTAAAPKAPATKTQYWVQVAAYSSKKAAEAARAVLDANKIQSDIFTYKDNKDNLYYRVRVGPYTTKSEAEYWRSKIIKINEFSKAESYITSTNTEL